MACAAADAPRVFHLVVGGALPLEWLAGFTDCELQPLPAGRTLICGLVADQAALQGLLRRLWRRAVVVYHLSCLDPGAAAQMQAGAGEKAENAGV